MKDKNKKNKSEIARATFEVLAHLTSLNDNVKEHRKHIEALQNTKISQEFVLKAPQKQQTPMELARESADRIRNKLEAAEDLQDKQAKEKIQDFNRNEKTKLKHKESIDYKANKGMHNNSKIEAGRKAEKEIKENSADITKKSSERLKEKLEASRKSASEKSKDILKNSSEKLKEKLEANKKSVSEKSKDILKNSSEKLKEKLEANKKSITEKSSDKSKETKEQFKTNKEITDTYKKKETQKDFFKENMKDMDLIKKADTKPDKYKENKGDITRKKW